ncbi:hypothetical protein [Sphingomonas flavalba]|uniref:hypothetical protein n=1 Tax=Sphingomonas flavalba TaxID=2559804 RepID=UPI00109DEFD1|nr:hypothetical protein [Sphingomonas flavalba]
MIGKVIGALVGREIDRRDGKGGVKGAVLGAAVAGGLRRFGPLGLVIGGAYVAKKLYDRGRAGRAAPEPPPAP